MPRNDDTLMMRKPNAPLGIIALDSFRKQIENNFEASRTEGDIFKARVETVLPAISATAI